MESTNSIMEFNPFDSIENFFVGFPFAVSARHERDDQDIVLAFFANYEEAELYIEAATDASDGWEYTILEIRKAELN